MEAYPGFDYWCTYKHQITCKDMTVTWEANWQVSKGGRTLCSLLHKMAQAEASLGFEFQVISLEQQVHMQMLLCMHFSFNLGASISSSAFIFVLFFGCYVHSGFSNFLELWLSWFFLLCINAHWSLFSDPLPVIIGQPATYPSGAMNWSHIMCRCTCNRRCKKTQFWTVQMYKGDFYLLTCEWCNQDFRHAYIYIM